MKYNHLNSYEWIGDFWLENTKNTKFSGLLTYSPSKGIRLVTLQYTFDKDYHDSFLTIHGYTHETGCITLLRCISAGTLSLKGSSCNPTYLCEKLIIGGHYSINNYFSSVSVGFNNLNEFCYPQGFSAEDEYTTSNIVESNINHKGKSISVSLKQEAVGIFIIPTLSRLFLMGDKEEDLKERINSDFNDLLEKYDLKTSTIKKEITYVFNISEKNINEDLDILDHMSIIFSIMSLLSVLMLRKIKPTSITAHDKTTNKICHVLNTFYITESDIESLRKDTNHNLLPLNLKDIKSDFQNSFAVWHGLFSEKLNIRVSTILNHILDNIDHVQHFILLLTTLEQISMNEYENYKGSEKYSWAINKYSSPSLLHKLNTLSPVGVSIGEHISNLRICIIHPKSLESKKYDKYKNHISIQSIYNISQMLFVILAHSLYVSIDLNSSATEKFINRHDFFIKTYHEY